ncbi:hypothetical protein BCR44DRAFT_69593 [Catenaria anguillulae PL171]|uniref:Cilia-and flagella-associated protein 96 n=1 Tax=Catenaria anguillulae PL171 TaxID=765915 RepID=A0A1Y2HD60_9FUNG|nr:hypothetical protein BCR44DRAFT_69593 [Catenaria anguillulae PL171]
MTGGEQADDGRRPAIERMGLFSEMGYLKTGNPAAVKEKKPQEQGKQFTTTPAKEGTYFAQSYARAFQGEAYTDLVVVRRQYRREQSQRNLNPAGFRPSNVPPRGSGKGSIYGTISQQYPLTDTPPPLPPAPDTSAPKQATLRNLYTAPPKKGGFGYVDGTIGKPYGYLPSPYDAEHKLSVELAQKSKQMRVDSKPFVGSVHERPFFDENPFTGASPFTIAQRPHSPQPEKPWRPTSCAQPYLNTFPEYRPHNPHPSKSELEQAVRDQVEARKAQQQAESHSKFRPVGASCHSYPCSSIVAMNVPKAPSGRVRGLISELRGGPGASASASVGGAAANGNGVVKKGQ